MSLDINYELSKKLHTSAFPVRRRIAVDETVFGKEITLSKFTSVREYIQSIYGAVNVTGITGFFGFLNRDNKEKDYDAKSTDPFVFSDQSSIAKFRQEALALLEVLCEIWESYGLSCIVDPDRNVKMPDVDSITNQLLAGLPRSKWTKEAIIYFDNREILSPLVANLDTLKKACVVRNVHPGWWLTSYTGGKTANLGDFSDALDCVMQAIDIIKASPQYSSTLQSVLDDQGDPLDTGVGWPIFSGEITAEGVPVSKLKILELAKGVGYQGFKWASIVLKLASKVKDTGMRHFPLAVAPIRRLMSGYKWTHVWKPTYAGLKLDGDIRGYCSNRVAWMAPWIWNLYLSPIQSEWKALRKLMPGMFHDSKSWTKMLSVLDDPKSYVIESDYSNYDRSIPNDLINEFCKRYFKNHLHADYYIDLIRATNTNVNILFPDWLGTKKGVGWGFTAPSLGLLSGLKITSDIGSFVNLFIVIKSLLVSGWSREKVVHYLTAKVKGDSYRIQFLILSDDTLFVDQDPDFLSKWISNFKKVGDVVGVKSTIGLGDRFLMRHVTRGFDFPVAARVWQNTLSNEEPYVDALKFSVGLSTRSDGMFGYKTIDAFGRGKNIGMDAANVKFSLAVVKSIRSFLVSSATPVKSAIVYIDALISAGNRMIDRGGHLYVNDRDGRNLDVLRKLLVEELTTRESDQVLSSNADLWLMKLNKDKASPAVARLIEELMKMSDRIKNAMIMMSKREHKFYLFAMKTVGIDQRTV